MEYKAIMTFVDATGGNKTYRKGDVFEGTEERIKELSTKNNKAGFPVIEGVPDKEDEKAEEPKKEEKPKKKAKKTDKKKEAKGSK